MRKYLKDAIVLFGLICAATGSSRVLFAEDGPSRLFAGTWALNAAKSTYRSELLVYTDPQDNTAYRLTFRGSGVKAIVDGKPRPENGVETQWSATRAGQWIQTIRVAAKGEDGKVTYMLLETNSYTLLKRGELMQYVAREYRPYGSAEVAQSLFRRTGIGEGFVGKWRLVRELQSGNQIIRFSVPTPHVIGWWHPGLQEAVSGPTDGSDLYLHGPNSESGISISFTRVGPRKLEFLRKVHGLIEKKGSYVVSGDGRTLTQTEWITGRETEIDEAVYERAKLREHASKDTKPAN